MGQRGQMGQRWQVGQGPVSERGLVSEWVGECGQVSRRANGWADWDRERAGGRAWADEQALAGGQRAGKRVWAGE